MTTPLAPDFRPQYHQLHRVGRPGSWRSLVGALAAPGAGLRASCPLVAGRLAFVALLAGAAPAREAPRDPRRDRRGHAGRPGGCSTSCSRRRSRSTWLVTWWLCTGSSRAGCRRSRRGCAGATCWPASPCRWSRWSPPRASRSCCPPRRRGSARRRAQRLHHARTRDFLLVDPAAHAAAGGRRGVPLPRLPHPGVRLAAVGAPGVAGARRAGAGADLRARSTASAQDAAGLLRPLRLRGRRRASW